MKKIIYLISFTLFAHFSWAASHDHSNHENTSSATHKEDVKEKDDHAGHDEHEEEAIKLSPNVLKEFGIELSTAQGGTKPPCRVKFRLIKIG